MGNCVQVGHVKWVLKMDINLELIDRNLLVFRLKQLKVDVSGFVRPSRANYLCNQVEDFISTEVVDLVLKQPCIKIDENLQKKFSYIIKAMK